MATARLPDIFADVEAMPTAYGEVVWWWRREMPRRRQAQYAVAALSAKHAARSKKPFHRPTPDLVLFLQKKYVLSRAAPDTASGVA